jgi:hypothetical protein
VILENDGRRDVDHDVILDQNLGGLEAQRLRVEPPSLGGLEA